MKNYSYLIALAIIVLAIIVGSGIASTIVGSGVNTTSASGDGLLSRACTITSASTTAIGHQEAKLIIASSSRRAWLRIQSPVNATNTAFFSATNNGTSTIGKGLAIDATSTPRIDLGLNTDYPVVSDIYGLTDKGTTTVLITECRYPL